MARDAWKWEKMGKIQNALCCGRPPNLQASSSYYVLVGGVSFKQLISNATKTQKDTKSIR